ncbi:MAG TPA: KH domain-containing protein [Candidatus Eremiobacteraceae bacterium]|nr:KH domain-containing protein [Candidatus Eremiobacteraceae bacterium]
MPERPTDFIDFDDEEPQPAPRAEAIDFDDDEDVPPQREPQPIDDEEDPGNLRDGIGRAAAVLKYIVEQIVDEPDEIQIGASTDDRGPVLLLRVAEDDRGKVIGRQGRIVQAIRTIVKAASVGSGEKVNVEILD